MHKKSIFMYLIETKKGIERKFFRLDDIEAGKLSKIKPEQILTRKYITIDKSKICNKIFCKERKK